MASTAEEFIDRRQLRKKVSFWRIVAFGILGLSLIGVIVYSARDNLFSSTSQNHVARVEITGVITNDGPMLKLLKQIEESEKVSGVVLNISSPGGSTVGGEAMYEAVRSISEKKPVVTSVGTLATSAGYMIASGTDRIFARRSSILGSIGVLFQYADASKLLDNIGVKIATVKSSPLKAEPNPFNPASEEAIEMIDNVIQDSYQWFVELVAERRSMPTYKVRELADGSIYSGGQSLENGLIDEIGGEKAAFDWLVSENELSKDLKIIDYKPKRPGDGLFNSSMPNLLFAKLFGVEIGDSEARALKKFIEERVLLDGLVSIWHGSAK